MPSYQISNTTVSRITFPFISVRLKLFLFLSDLFILTS